MPAAVKGWLFDAYPSSAGITIWLAGVDGGMRRVRAPFMPSFFLHLGDPDVRKALSVAAGCTAGVTCARATRRELYSNRDIDVLDVRVHNPLLFRSVVLHFEKYFPHFVFFNSDIPPAQLYFYETRLFPLAFGEYLVDGSGILTSWELQDSRDALEYPLPSLSTMAIRPAAGSGSPRYRRFLQLEISYDNRAYLIEAESSTDVLNALNFHLVRCDPDIVLTEYGDAAILPQITSLARRCSVPMALNRDREAGYTVSRASSFFQYGKVVHREGAFHLAGRWHIDATNSFTMAEADLDGVYELARVTQLPVQRQVRASIGTALSSLQLSWAYRNGYLIPSKKREPEEFKSAAALLRADRGGLIFQPPTGYHEGVAELDFVSMYPSIMTYRNVSPETVNCRCCSNRKVPELEYSICEKREGIVPATLRSVVEKRSYYKRMQKYFKGRDKDRFRNYYRRQTALKWMLVSCFGYLGYKNARFGRIEAHESVNAFSRDMILSAKEIAEEAGFRLVHAIIDCLWLKKEGAAERDYIALCRSIARRIGIDISLEGIYDWILFPPSKVDPALPTANRYAGSYTNGEIKIRGIEARRRDTPPLIRKMQLALLERMSAGKTISGLRSMVPGLLATGGEFISLLQSGRADPLDLVMRRILSKEADEYTNNSISAVAARLVRESGVHLSAGESVEFIIIDQSGKKKPEKVKPLSIYAFEDGYDSDKYTELALSAIETLLSPLGYDMERLKSHYAVLTGRKKQRGAGVSRRVRSGVHKGELRQFDIFSSNL